MIKNKEFEILLQKGDAEYHSKSSQHRLDVV